MIRELRGILELPWPGDACQKKGTQEHNKEWKFLWTFSHMHMSNWWPLTISQLAFLLLSNRSLQSPAPFLAIQSLEQTKQEALGTPILLLHRMITRGLRSTYSQSMSTAQITRKGKGWAHRCLLRQRKENRLVRIVSIFPTYVCTRSYKPKKAS